MHEEARHLDSLDRFPRRKSWLLLQFTGPSQDDVDQQGRSLLAAVGRDEDDDTVVFSDDPKREQAMLKAREAGLGVTARPPDGRETWEGWEDSAVAPEHLGDYLRDLKKLFDRYGYDQASLYGHFGQGCVHTRIPFDLKNTDGIAAFRRFLFDAADLVASYGGSLSGEHGDGQARGELLPRMFGAAVIEAFGKSRRCSTHRQDEPRQGRPPPSGRREPAPRRALAAARLGDPLRLSRGRPRLQPRGDALRRHRQLPQPRRAA